MGMDREEIDAAIDAALDNAAELLADPVTWVTIHEVARSLRNRGRLSFTEVVAIVDRYRGLPAGWTAAWCSVAARSRGLHGWNLLYGMRRLNPRFY
jgi:hypothetical protein